MKSVVVRRFGGPEVLEIIDVPLPVPAPSQVRVRVAAAAVKRIDISTRTGALVAAGLMASSPECPLGCSGIGDGSYDDGCVNLPDCTTTSLPGGGTLWITHNPGGDKSGTDLMFAYNRPQGGHIWLMERNYGTGSGPVTRDGLLLIRAEGRALVTSPTWDSLFN